MSNVVNISTFKAQSFSICLRQLYRRLDRISLDSSIDLESRKDFFIKCRGEFLSVSRKKKKIAIEDVAEYLGANIEFIEKIETGKQPIYDRTFIKLCSLYGTLDDSNVLAEKIENALKPNLRKAREKVAQDLERIGFGLEKKE